MFNQTACRLFPQAVLIFIKMKRFTLYLTLFVCFTLYTNCSLKHKWRTNQKESISRKKQEHIRHSITSERMLIDTGFQYTYAQLKNYRLWTLSGNVHIQADGSLQSDHAILQTWHSETDSLENYYAKTAYVSDNEEDQYVLEDATELNRNMRHKEKRKANTNWWWLVLLVLLPLGVLITRRGRLLSR